MQTELTAESHFTHTSLRSLILWLILGVVIALTAETGDLPDAAGMKDACVAGTMLNSSNIPAKVVVVHSRQGDQAACIYRSQGSTFVYTQAGTAQVDPGKLSQVSQQPVSKVAAAQGASDDRDLSNGCLVYATCAFAQDKRDPHVRWAGIVAARVIDVDGDMVEPTSAGTNGHAITAYEDDDQNIFIQTDGGETKKLDDLTDKAKAGDKSWHDASDLIYHDHHVQGIAKFEAQYGNPK